MSRVVYTDIRSTSEQEALRLTHQVRLVTADEEGNGVDTLPGGVYGFTYAPGLPGAPLFAQPRFRTYETHKLPSGAIYIIGFTTVADARAMSTSVEDYTLQIHPQPEGDYDTIVTIPYASMRRHRQYAAPNQDGFTVTVMPI
jgi:hypothetical protein